MNKPNLFLLLVLNETAHIDSYIFVYGVDGLFEDLGGSRGNMQVQRGVLVRCFGPVGIPHALGADGTTSFLADLAGMLNRAQMSR
jgi:hypothetical protein